LDAHWCVWTTSRFGSHLLTRRNAVLRCAREIHESIRASAPCATQKKSLSDGPTVPSPSSCEPHTLRTLSRGAARAILSGWESHSWRCDGAQACNHTGDRGEQTEVIRSNGKGPGTSHKHEVPSYTETSGAIGINRSIYALQAGGPRFEPALPTDAKRFTLIPSIGEMLRQEVKSRKRFTPDTLFAKARFTASVAVFLLQDIHWKAVIS
jgi:hypothetical protein